MEEAKKEEYDFTAFPTGQAREERPSIRFTDKSEKRILHTLEEWWTAGDVDGVYNPSIEFRLPKRNLDDTFPASLHFVSYQHPNVTARLYVGESPEPAIASNGQPVMMTIVRHPRGTNVAEPVNFVDQRIRDEDNRTRQFIVLANDAMTSTAIVAQEEDVRSNPRKIGLFEMMGRDMGYGDAARRILQYEFILRKGAEAIYDSYKKSDYYVPYYEKVIWKMLMEKRTEKMVPLYESLLAEGFKPNRLHDTVVKIVRARRRREIPGTSLPEDIDLGRERMKRPQSDDEQDEDIFNTPVRPFSNEEEERKKKVYKLTPEREQEVDVRISSIVSVIGASMASLSSAIAGVLPEIPEPVECNSCGKTRATMRCSRCKAAHYCNRECQLSHWGKAHSAMCKSK